MTSFISAILLGIIQGLTEFIPVSSTGHLLLFENFINFPEIPGRVFEVVIQQGSAFAVLISFRKRLLTPLVSPSKKDLRFFLSLIIATIPAAILGVLFHGFIKTFFYGTSTIAISLILGGIVFFLIEKSKSPSILFQAEGVPFPRSLFIGFAQSLALIPGVSRSGATIASSRFMGLDRRSSIEFSFFMAVPILLGAGFFDLYKTHAVLEPEHLVLLSTGFLAAFFTSFLVFQPFIRLVERFGLIPFAWYRIILGLILILS